MFSSRLNLANYGGHISTYEKDLSFRGVADGNTEGNEQTMGRHDLLAPLPSQTPRRYYSVMPDIMLAAMI